MMQSLRLKDRRILLGVTGSIAAYKACEVLRMLKKEGAEVQVIMTQAACRFVHPLTFETLSGKEAIHDLFPSDRVVQTRHVRLADWAECILVCPATANIIGKMASGIADDFLSTVIMAARSPVLIAPAMDYEMFQHPIFIENCEKLKRLGYHFIDSEKGELASGKVGPGRLAGFPHILDGVKSVLLGSTRLKGYRVLVTAGPTREAIDPVRFITNRSSGKMGFALAEEARLRGADVTLIHGPVMLREFAGIRILSVESAKEMAKKVKDEWKHHDILVMTAAVADYRPMKTAEQKLKKGTDTWSLILEKTEDILFQSAKEKGKRIVVGFALETEKGEANALKKLENKNLDLICLNSPRDPGSGFETDTTQLTLYSKKNDKTVLPLIPKWEASLHIWDQIEGLLTQKP